MTAEQIRLPDDVGQLLKNFQDQSRDYMQRVTRHRKKNGELIDVEVTAFNLEFDGQAGARKAVSTARLSRRSRPCGAQGPRRFSCPCEFPRRAAPESRGRARSPGS